MMRASLSCIILAMTSQPLWANSQSQITNLNEEAPPPNSTQPDSLQLDSRDIDDAFNGIINKKPEITIQKTSAIIARFESDRKDNVNHICTYSPADTLASLIGLAAITSKNEDGSEANSENNGGASNEASDESAEKITQTIAISSNICDAYFLKGFALIDVQKREEALPYLESATQLDPDNQRYLNELAEWHKVNKDWETSLAIFTKASETTDLAISLSDDKKSSKRLLDGRRCRSYRGIAFNHAEMKNWKQARAAAKACLKLIPDDPGSLGELEYIKKNEGKK